MKNWVDALPAHAIIAQQNFALTTGKNAADIALVIDAMDLLHTGRFDAFCLVSSDSDFTRLAARIREQGVDVYGFGERKTPESFRMACKRFIYTENLSSAEQSQPMPLPKHPGAESADSVGVKQHPADAVPHICTALTHIDDLDGWYALGTVGARLANLMPDFDSRTYGCSKLLTLVENTSEFEVRRDDLRVYIRPRKKR